MSKKEKEICEFETNLRNCFCVRRNLSNTNIISVQRPGLKTGMDFRGLVLKTGMENDIFWSRLFTVPYFFVRSFRYTVSCRHGYLDFQMYRGGGRRGL